MRLYAVLAAVAVLSGGLAAHADSTFNFESTAIGTALPFSITNNGLTAAFSGSGAVCASGSQLSSLYGNVLIQGYCDASGPGAIAIAFSQPLSSLSFDFATAGGANSIVVEEFSGGTELSTTGFNSTVPPSYYNGEGFVALSGNFDGVVITSLDYIALDNLDAVPTTAPMPEPSSLALLGTSVIGAAGLLRRRLFS
jgi:hypothetical protein